MKIKKRDVILLSALIVFVGIIIVITAGNMVLHDPRSLSKDSPEVEDMGGVLSFFSASTGGNLHAHVDSNNNSAWKKSNNNNLLTWKRSNIIVNTSKLSVGEKDELPLKGAQIAVQIDGFRARVAMDYFYYNDKNQQLEGTFKLRLPNEASPYFFAFGEMIHRNKDAMHKPLFLKYVKSSDKNQTPQEIMEMRRNFWNNPKEARIVPKVKAAFAYSQTVSKDVDPALMEWAGSGIFQCRVFPLQPKTLHRIVVGYDVNLIDVGGKKLFRFPVPSTSSPLVIDFDFAALEGVQPTITPEKKLISKNGRYLVHFKNPTIPEITIHYPAHGPMLLTSSHNGEQYMAASFRPNLLATSEVNVPENAIFAVDISLSSHPDKFNVWLKVLEATLNNNRDALKNFAVLFFNVEVFWWKKGFTQNTPENVHKLLDFAKGLSLEGATDLGLALEEINVPHWEENIRYRARNIFLLSDGSATWGEGHVHYLTGKLTQNNHLYAYTTAFVGTATNILEHLTRGTGGALFSVISEEQVAKVSRAFRKKPWRIERIKIKGSSDLLVAGRPQYLYPGQLLNVAGRGKPDKDALLVFTVSQNGIAKKLKIPFAHRISSDLARRAYGQIATIQLEELAFKTRKYSQSYATHFRVPGQTCSLLMLETEQDYRRHNIRPQEDALLVKKNPVNKIIESSLKNLSSILDDVKTSFLSFLKDLSQAPGVKLKISKRLEKLLEALPVSNFKVNPTRLHCQYREKSKITNYNYDTIVKVANHRKKKFSSDDALKIMSSLIERNPGDVVLARDIAFSAMEWGLNSQAYQLFKRVSRQRPYEPQTYQKLAQVLTKMGNIDLAIAYYEVALAGNWQQRFGDFRNIVGLEYLQLLRQINNGKYHVSFPTYAKSRWQALKQEFVNQSPQLMVCITWNTDDTDVDLHVIEPSGEECYFGEPQSKSGGTLTEDRIRGYGPEMYLLPQAPAGKYRIKVNYFASNRNRTSTHTKVYLIVYQNLGASNEKIIKKTITLKENNESHDILTLTIE